MKKIFSKKQEKFNGETNSKNVAPQKKSKQINSTVIMTVSLAICALIGVLFIINLINNVNSYEFEESAVQYYADMKIEISQDSEMIRNAEDKTIMSRTENNKELSSIAIYYENKDKLVLPHNMSYYNPSKNTRQKLDYFTELEIQNGVVIASRDGKKVPLVEGFLHDGEDYYIFLEPTTIELEHYTVDLGPLSFVELVYQQYVMVFDYQNEIFYTESARGNILATPETELYELYLINDTVIDASGEKSMLITKPEFLPRIFD